jgi:hypothetical protein
MLKVMLLIFMIGFVSAVEVELDCPDDVFVDESFECMVEVFDGDGVYDLKVEVDSERDSVLKILDGSEWKSSYYYLKGFVRDDEVVGLKIMESGRYDVVVKLRQGDEREEFDVGRISVEAPIGHDSGDTEGDVVGDEENVIQVISLDEGSEIIALGGGVVVEDDEEWDYVSKDGKIIDWLPYGFCLFLILLVGVLMWERF